MMMKPTFLFSFLLAAFLVASVHARALPLQSRALSTRLLVDAPAFEDPSNPSNTLAAFESFVFISPPNLSPVTSLVKSTLTSLGLNIADVGGKLATAVDRMKLFAAVGVPDVSVDVRVKGCSVSAVTIPVRTALKDLGIATGNTSIGSCSGPILTASVLSPTDNLEARIFLSPPTGFGVISDIDDTMKVSNVLNKKLLLKNTLYNDPKAVTGMPELYASLAKSLSTNSVPPQFIYLSGSPIQLYPFLRSFIQKEYSHSLGPLLLQNFSVANPSVIKNSRVLSLINENGGQNKIDYKVSQISRVAGMYPKKSFLAIGDSTEKDPEVYGKAFNIHGSAFIRCIWIRVVDGGDNADARFAKAFTGVPKEKIRRFTDEQIDGLKNVDVAGGKC